MDAVLGRLAEAMPELEDVYRDLHAHPELAYAEYRTAKIVADRLRVDGFDVYDGIGVTGVVGIRRNGEGPTVVLRADMDGLPVEEQTGLDYASTATGLSEKGEVVPLMHACGHDVHVTCLLGAVQAMSAAADRWSGTLVALFQPAEEGRGGARAMIDDGLFDLIGKPDIILGQHVFPTPAGTVGYRSGAILSASDAFDIRVFGRGGHGSQPHSTVDPVVLASSIVMRLQTIVSREIAPADRVALTVGSIQAGSTGNIISDHADLIVSARSFDEGVAARVVASIRRIVEAECLASNSPKPPEFVELVGFKPTINDAESTDRVVRSLRARLGDEAVVEVEPYMGSEDFPEFGRSSGAPYVFWTLGGTDSDAYAEAEANGTLDSDIPTNHSPYFAPVIQPTLTTGVTALVAAAMEWLSTNRPPNGREV
ncbi:amidohydrolase [Nocardia testacea]|uniref:amidohydrolase n=1 Tax=Nocardia testacea TaxID=248551 RepID=UPI003A8BFD18